MTVSSSDLLSSEALENVLNFHGEGIRRLNDIGKILLEKELDGLTLSNNKLTQLSEKILSKLVKLAYLNVAQNSMSDLKFLLYLPSLSVLNASHNFLEVLNNLENCKNLRKIVVSHNAIESIEICDYVPQLFYINVKHNNIKSFPSTYFLPELCTLRIDFNYLTKLRGLEKYKKLSQLTASHNLISVIDQKSDCFIRDMDLSHNKIATFSLFKSFVKLTKLNMSYNPITDKSLETSCVLPNVIFLSVAHCNISNPKRINRIFPNLEILDLSSNPIGNFNRVLDFVKNAKKLKSFDLRKTPLFSDTNSNNVEFIKSNIINSSVIGLEILNGVPVGNNLSSARFATDSPVIPNGNLNDDKGVKRNRSVTTSYSDTAKVKEVRNNSVTFVPKKGMSATKSDEELGSSVRSTNVSANKKTQLPASQQDFNSRGTSPIIESNLNGGISKVGGPGRRSSLTGSVKRIIIHRVNNASNTGNLHTSSTEKANVSVLQSNSRGNSPSDANLIQDKVRSNSDSNLQNMNSKLDDNTSVNITNKDTSQCHDRDIHISNISTYSKSRSSEIKLYESDTPSNMDDKVHKNLEQSKKDNNHVFAPSEKDEHRGLTAPGSKNEFLNTVEPKELLDDTRGTDIDASRIASRGNIYTKAGSDVEIKKFSSEVSKQKVSSGKSLSDTQECSRPKLAKPESTPNCSPNSMGNDDTNVDQPKEDIRETGKSNMIKDTKDQDSHSKRSRVSGIDSYSDSNENLSRSSRKSRSSKHSKNSKKDKSGKIGKDTTKGSKNSNNFEPTTDSNKRTFMKSNFPLRRRFSADSQYRGPYAKEFISFTKRSSSIGHPALVSFISTIGLNQPRKQVSKNIIKTVNSADRKKDEEDLILYGSWSPNIDFLTKMQAYNSNHKRSLLKSKDLSKSENGKDKIKLDGEQREELRAPKKEKNRSRKRHRRNRLNNSKPGTPPNQERTNSSNVSFSGDFKAGNSPQISSIEKMKRNKDVAVEILHKPGFVDAVNKLDFLIANPDEGKTNYALLTKTDLKMLFSYYCAIQETEPDSRIKLEYIKSLLKKARFMEKAKPRSPRTGTTQEDLNTDEKSNIYTFGNKYGIHNPLDPMNNNAFDPGALYRDKYKLSKNKKTDPFSEDISYGKLIKKPNIQQVLALQNYKRILYLINHPPEYPKSIKDYDKSPYFCDCGNKNKGNMFSTIKFPDENMLNYFDSINSLSDFDDYTKVYDTYVKTPELTYPFNSRSPRKLPWDYDQVSIIQTKKNKKPKKPQPNFPIKSVEYEIIKLAMHHSQPDHRFISSDKVYKHFHRWLSYAAGSDNFLLKKLVSLGNGERVKKLDSSKGGRLYLVFIEVSLPRSSLPANSPVTVLRHLANPQRYYLVCITKLERLAISTNVDIHPDPYTLSRIQSSNYDGVICKVDNVEYTLIFNRDHIIPVYSLEL